MDQHVKPWRISLIGENSFGLQAELQSLMDQFKQAHGALAIERLSGADVSPEQLRTALTSVPFLADAKLIRFDEPSKSPDFSERIEEYLHELPTTTQLLLVEPKPDKRSRYYKSLVRLTTVRQFHAIDPARLIPWVRNYVTDRGGSIGAAEARHLVAWVGPQQQRLASELDKLLLYSTVISKQSIELLVDKTIQSTIFELLDAALRGKKKAALVLYAEQRSLKVEPQQIIAMLSWQLHIVTVLQLAQDRSIATIASESGLSPYVLEKSKTIALSLGLEKTKQLIHKLLAIDILSKTRNVSVDEALQNYILAL